MKKTTALLLVLVLLLSCMAVLTACGSSDKDSKTKDTKEKITTKASSQNDDEDDNGDNNSKETGNSALNGGSGNGGSSYGAGAESAEQWDGTADTSWYDENKESFVLTTAEQLAGFAQLVNEIEPSVNTTINVTLGADINLSGKEWTPIAYHENNKVNGIFDGAGHAIYNLNISSSDGQYIGLFGACHFEVKNIGLENVSISATPGSAGAYIGAIAGNLNTSGSYEGIKGCYATGSISATSTGNVYVGGLVGEIIVGDVEACYSTVAVTTTVNLPQDSYLSESAAGGLVGTAISNWGDKYIHRCYATGNVTATVTGGNVYVGGLLGFSDNAGARIMDSYATGTVKAENSSSDGINSVGGLVGESDVFSTIVSNCFRCPDQVIATGATENTLGTEMQEAQITTMTFYTETLDKWNYSNDLDWDAAVWVFADGSHPTLKYTPAAN